MASKKEQMHWINLASSILKQQDELRSVLHKILKDNNFYVPAKRLSGGRNWLEIMWFEALANFAVSKSNAHLAEILYRHRLQGYVHVGYNEKFVRYVFDTVAAIAEKNGNLFDDYLIHTKNKTLKGSTDYSEVSNLLLTKFNVNDLVAINTVFETYQNNITKWLDQYDFVEDED
jgi:hypothetical protein